MDIIQHNFDRNFLPTFVKKYFENRDNLNILEIGTYEGSYALKIYEIFPKSFLYLLDTWDSKNTDFYYSVRPGTVESAYTVAQSRFNDKQNVSLLKESSQIVFNNFENDFFDWIYIDGDHSYEAVKLDLHNWFSKLKNGGIMSGHDWDVDPQMSEFNMFGVQRAVIEFLQNSPDVELNLTNEQYHKSWLFMK